MSAETLWLGWADPSAAGRYRADTLSAQDASRASRPRSERAERDWRASRALLHDLRSTIAGAGRESLSHSAGHALCARAPAGWDVGADLERMRPRDIRPLAPWSCDPAECAMLDALAGDSLLECFYLLWTLKESFVKAAGLDFPRDLRSVGLRPCPRGGGLQLRAPAGGWRARSYRLAPDWIASVVWRQPCGLEPEIRWRAAAGCSVPALRPLGAWSAD